MKTIRVWCMVVCVVLAAGWPSSPAAAQNLECPQTVLLALARAGTVCREITPNQACMGNGTVEAALESGTFAVPGDVVPVGALRELHTGGGAEWSVVTLKIQADLIDAQQRSITLLLFGEVAITNDVPYAPTLPITATGLLYVRTDPRPDADIVTQLGLRDAATAIGRTDDRAWLRIIIPGTGDFGWVSTAVLAADGDIQTLPVVDKNTPYERPFQVFTLRTGAGDAPCTGAPESGLLLQTPNTVTPVTLVINGAILRLAATAFVQAVPGEALTVDVLDGQAEILVGDVTRFIPAGARIAIPLDEGGQVSGPPAAAEPYTLSRLEVLPVNNLPYRFTLRPALTQAEIDTQTAQVYAPTPTPAPPPSTPEDRRCVRTVARAASQWAGPGMFYEIVRPLEFGTRVDPLYQVTDADGYVWWQLPNTNWIRADAVTTTGDCPPVPVTDTVQAPPANTLPLETCETTNGPVRVGQRVTITFVPPSWEGEAAAREAPRWDPGRITVGNQSLRMSWTEPVEIYEDHYVRTFSGVWTAEAGTYRVTGQRLHYIVTCDLTVPVGR